MYGSRTTTSRCHALAIIRNVAQPQGQIGTLVLLTDIDTVSIHFVRESFVRLEDLTDNGAVNPANIQPIQNMLVRKRRELAEHEKPVGETVKLRLWSTEQTMRVFTMPLRQQQSQGTTEFATPYASSHQGYWETAVTCLDHGAKVHPRRIGTWAGREERKCLHSSAAGRSILARNNSKAKFLATLQ